jgi:Tol biopolymer transport system component
MPIATGTRLGPYEIESMIGAGGMGEVHRARDTRLDRTVAIKVLSQHLSGDSQLQERFRREVRAISSLNHPNICTLYDVGHEKGVDFLVMEYLEGQTLADRLSKGPLPIAEAFSIAIQVADALDKAHRARITHRDLKPGNVMLTKAGAKLLDFGLARTVPAARADNMSVMPTAQPNLSAEGTILGTLPYMSPEQIEGADTDERADIWALGCLLYEMVTARQAFSGATQASLITAIMSRDPQPLSEFQLPLPVSLDRLIRNCLVKDPNRRWQNALDVSLELKGIAAGEAAAVSVAGPTRRSRSLVVAGTLFAVLAVGLPALWVGSRIAGVAAKPQVRFEVAPPPGTHFPDSVETAHLAISPDSSTLAFIAIGADGVSRIWARMVSELDPHPLPGTEGANSIVWSPDGQSLAFFGSGKLRRLDLPNGAPVPICDLSQGIGFAGSWGESGEILFASVQGEAIYRVAASGGTPEKILVTDAARKELRMVWPRILPGGHGFLYLSRTADQGPVLMWVPPGNPPRVVAPLSSRFELIEPDLLVFVRDGALIAQRFDLNSGQLTGVPVSIAPWVKYFYSSGWAGFAVSPEGSVFYLTGENSSRLVWLNRAGKAENEVGKPGNYLSIALSPDGRSVVADRTQPSLGTYDLWLLDLERNVETRLTSSPDADFGASWLPDGKGIVYSSVRGSSPNLIRRNLTTGDEDTLVPRRAFQQSTDVSPDGRTLAFIERGPDGGFRASTLQLEGDPKPTALFTPDSRHEDVRFSPDGAFVAYLSDESGEWEAYVASLANRSDKIRISEKGARRLRWRRNSPEILLLAPDGKMLSVSVRTTPRLTAGAPVTLFTLPGGNSWYDFDVTSDGQRFLALERVQEAGSHPASAILNWSPNVSR